MKISQLLAVLVVVATLILAFEEAFGQNPAADARLETVLAGLETRYDMPFFSAPFVQHSKMAVMEMEDKATGRLHIKRPGKMRWEYETPERQIVVSDAVQLWIYRPADRQVLIGKAPAYFSDGKGASFLSDMKVLRRNFTITLEPETDAAVARLKLVPKQRTADLAFIVLEIKQDGFSIDTITTTNAYGDETRIEIGAIQTDAPLADALFSFEIPPGTEILNLE
jgi:outer membrane lipoprotein carrier protein